MEYNASYKVLGKASMLILLFFFITSFLTAQNYQSVNSGRIAYFESIHDGEIKSIRIDSTEYQTDSILYPFRNIQEISDNCFLPNVASWMGDKIIIQKDGVNLFFNRNGDTIAIKTSASLNESWKAYSLADSFSVIASVTKHDTLTFLGLTDSVKTIEFQAYNKEMNPVAFRLNEISLLLSQHYGWVRTVNFYLFPDLLTGFNLDRFDEYDLAGLSSPQKGVQNLTWFDVFDFQPGDERHILYESSDHYNSYSFSAINKTILTYLTRNDYTDSIKYSVKRKQSLYSVLNGSSSFAFHEDTIRQLIKPNPEFDKLPGETVMVDEFGYTYHMQRDTKIKPSINNMFLTGGVCWQMVVADGCFSDYEYLRGLGGPYYSCSNAFTLGGEKSELVYYKKGQKIWGIPLVITGISESNYKDGVDLFPNPASEIIQINTHLLSLPVSFELIDRNGRKILEKEIAAEISSVPINHIAHGLYVYRLLSGKGEVIKTGKIIVE